MNIHLSGNRKKGSKFFLCISGTCREIRLLFWRGTNLLNILKMNPFLSMARIKCMKTFLLRVHSLLTKELTGIQRNLSVINDEGKYQVFPDTAVFSSCEKSRPYYHLSFCILRLHNIRHNSRGIQKWEKRAGFSVAFIFLFIISL